MSQAAGRQVSWPKASTVVAIVLVATVPFLDKPLHIDDSADLQYVDQIRSHPSDPYGFLLDWDEGPGPAFENYHPPLKYYYHAIVLALAPEHPVTLHLSFVPFVIATAWSIVSLARRFDAPPVAVLALWMLGPGYLPGQNAMLDVPVMALSLSATALFVHGVDAGRWPWVVLGSFSLGLAWCTKYSSLVYLPVWVCYLGLRGRPRDWMGLLVPVAIFIAWCLFGWWKYGALHPRVLVAGSTSSGSSIFERLVSGVVFLAGAMPAAAILLGMRKRTISYWAIAAVAAVAVSFLVPPERRVVNEVNQLDAVNFVWWCFLFSVGGAVVLSAIELMRRFSGRSTVGGSDGDALFLVVWFVATFGLGTIASPFVAMRRVVEAALPAWICLTRGAGSGASLPRAGVALAVCANSVLGLAVAAADYEFARIYKRMVDNLVEVAGPNPQRIWTHGYWGWFYYAGERHLLRYVVGGPAPPPKSLLIIPNQVAKPAIMPDSVRKRATRVASQAVPGWMPIRLMSYQAGAGYYSAAWGPLPYAWSRLPWEIFNYFELGDEESGSSASDRTGPDRG